MGIARIVAESVAVLCPACGEPHPNRDGSEMWTWDDFDRDFWDTVCVSCDHPMQVTKPVKMFGFPKKNHKNSPK